jgi:hypothetical protein
MKNAKLLSYLPLVALALLLASCRGRTDRSEGTVILSVTDFNGLPVQVSTTNGPFSVDSITLQNIPKDPGGTTSDLQGIELKSFEVRYIRRDTGTRVPPSMVQPIFGLVSVGGFNFLNNVPFLTTDQIRNLPLDDLRRRGVDSETGSAVVVLTVSIRFFGRTLSGDDIASDPASFNIEVRQ